MLKHIYYKPCTYEVYQQILQELINYKLLSPIEHVVPSVRKLLNYSIVLSTHSARKYRNFLYIIIYLEESAEIYNPIRTIITKYTFEDLGTGLAPNVTYLGPLTSLNTLHALFYRTIKCGNPNEDGNYFVLYKEDISRQDILHRIADFVPLVEERGWGRYGFHKFNENGFSDSYVVPEIAAATEIYNGILAYIETHGFERFANHYLVRNTYMDEAELVKFVTF